MASLHSRLKKQVAEGKLPRATVRMSVLAHRVECAKCGQAKASLFRQLRVMTTRANVLRFVLRCKECQSGAWWVSTHDVLRTERRAEAFARWIVEKEEVTNKEEQLEIVETCLEYVQVIELEKEYGTIYEASGMAYEQEHRRE